MKTIIITGGYGQLGESCNKNLKKDFNIIITGREAYKSGIKLDITDKNDIAKAYRNFKPDVVLNLAAMTDVDACEDKKEECEGLNVNAVRYLIDCATNIKLDLKEKQSFWGPYLQTDKRWGKLFKID